MLRPEQMSKVSVAGSKRVLESVIETVHGMNLLHLSDYDESWQDFELGRSLEGAEKINEHLVTVRSLETILGVSPEDADETIVVDEAELEAELASLQTRVNERDDKRSELRTQLRELDEQIKDSEPFVDLGLNLELLGGYDSLVVSVGEGNRAEIESTLADSEPIETFEIISGSRTHAVFAKPTADATGDILADALVGVEFTTVPAPDAEGSPEEYVGELEAQKAEVQSELETVESELNSISDQEAGFLLAAEEYLSLEAQKKEAPLSFATTKNAFVAEGWIPTDHYAEFESTLASAVDGPLDVDEIKRARFKSNGHAHVEETETPTTGETTTEEPTVSEGREAEEAHADGGVVTTNDAPPVVQDNPRGSKAFEVLVSAVAKPKYSEFDPTLLVFLTFPIMFGFMIGDIGYGVLYMLIGGYLYTKFDSSGLKDIGGVALWAGGFTVIFGFFYDEIFGLHPFAEPMSSYVGLPVLHKGLKPEYAEWALAWFAVSVLFGVLHLNIAYVVSFIEDLEFHGLKEAIYESGSWLIMLNGFWVFVFSPVFASSKPDFIFEVFNGAPLPFGFDGFSALAGTIGGFAFLFGVLLLLIVVPIEFVESLNVLVNALSYTRLGAVLLAKAGTAFAVNLIVFGAYNDNGNYHFIFTGEHLAELQASGAEIMFPGMMTAGGLGLVGGVLVLLVGHATVLALGVTSAGLQAVRLEYVEFFGKFYEGGGRDYIPFGHDRTYTTTDD